MLIHRSGQVLYLLSSTYNIQLRRVHTDFPRTICAVPIHSIITDTDARLAPFRIPQGVPESDHVAKLFNNFKSIFGMFTRVNRETSIASINAANKNRVSRSFEPGETVFRRMPRPSRLPKHLLPPPSRGPFKVHSQPDPYNLILKEPDKDVLVDGGAKIPLDQILAGPSRARLEFADESDLRPYSELIEGTRNASGTLSSGYRAGVRGGWGPLATGDMVAYRTKFNGPDAKLVSVGRVLVNERDRMVVDIQPYQAKWSQTKVTHHPLYQTPMGYTLVPGNPAKESVLYPALVAQVELLTGGELMHSCARRLADRGWGLLININESVRFLHDIRVESRMVQESVESHWNS